MPVVNLTLKELNDLVSPEALAQQGFRKPKRVEVSDYTSWDGDDAFKVLIIFANAVAEKDLRRSKTQPLVEWVFAQLWAAGQEERFPYISIIREADLKIMKRPTL
jgi:hypothetical protein